MRSPYLLIVIAGALLSCTASVLGATSALLIGPDLQPREVKLQALGGGKISFFDAERTMQIEPLGKVLQVRLVAEPVKSDDAGAKPQAAKDAAIVELIDGQRLIGKFTGADGEGQKLKFEHASLGEFTVNLDKVSRLVFGGERDNRATPAADSVLLSNGDAVTGFVVALGEKGVEIQQGNAKPFTLPRDRVRALILANPVQRAAGKQHMAWLRDGSRLLGADLSVSADKLTIHSALSGKPVTLPLTEVERLEVASLEGRLEDLADLPMTVTAGGRVFGLSLPPRIESGAIHLHAPVTVEFALPPGAKRFAAVAELDAAGEDASLADFIVNLRTAGETSAHHAVSGAKPRALINAEVSGRTLSITLDPAAHGPVMDRLRLRDAVVFIESR